jgi:DNA-binding beta-propeller fold protein YncE
VNADGSTIDEYNPKGTIINTITGFNGATAIAFDNAGNLYVGNINGGGADAGTITKIQLNGTRSTFASGLSYPLGMAFNAAGDLFVSDGNGFDAVTEITPGGTPSPFASGLDFNSAIAFDSAGDMFVANEAGGPAGGEILEYAAKGGESVYNDTIGSPMSLAFEGVTLPVPEPTSYAFFGLGLLTLALMSNKRKRTV